MRENATLKELMEVYKVRKKQEVEPKKHGRSWLLQRLQKDLLAEHSTIN